jgi:hypothetical protein
LSGESAVTEEKGEKGGEEEKSRRRRPKKRIEDKRITSHDSGER